MELADIVFHCFNMVIKTCWGCNFTAWYIAGVVWRFRMSGAYSSGDIKPIDISEERWVQKLTEEDSLYQYNSGLFIWRFMIGSWVYFFFQLIHSCIVIGSRVAVNLTG